MDDYNSKSKKKDKAKKTHELYGKYTSKYVRTQQVKSENSKNKDVNTNK